ncbi:hypothetical protein YK56LOC_33470 [Caballeronia sp. HLA56]
MKTRGTVVVGDNVQTAVDTKHHLIVAHVVTNDGFDRDHLASTPKLARAEMGVEKLTVFADRGYCKSEETLACHQAGTCSLFCGRSADADTSDEHAQIEGSPATQVGLTHRQISRAIGISFGDVSKFAAQASQAGLDWAVVEVR